MKGQNFASQVLSRHTFRISRKKGSDFFYHRGTLTAYLYTDDLDDDRAKNFTLLKHKERLGDLFPHNRLSLKFLCALQGKEVNPKDLLNNLLLNRHLQRHPTRLLHWWRTSVA